MNEQETLPNPPETALKDWVTPEISEMPMKELTEGAIGSGADAGIYS